MGTLRGVKSYFETWVGGPAPWCIIPWGRHTHTPPTFSPTPWRSDVLCIRSMLENSLSGFLETGYQRAQKLNCFPGRWRAQQFIESPKFVVHNGPHYLGTQLST